MKNSSSSCLLLLFILYVSVSFARRQVYMVHIRDHGAKRTLLEIEDKHFSFLMSVKNSKEEAEASLLYSYKHVINGFSALLTPDEAHTLSEMEGIVSVIRSEPKSYTIQTTRSWEFTNLLAQGNSGFDNGDEESLKNANQGENVIVGVLDTGIWPESQSFNDEGMEPVPQSWKGICQSGVDFNSSHCNRKLIGARYYLRAYEAHYSPLNDATDFRSARDRDGHGTHTASTVAGRRVPHATLPGGFANGTAAGGAPLARLAIYKVCWAIPGESTMFEPRCLNEDILAAFDDAIIDGVHVISISIVPDDNLPYELDGLALGAFHAAKKDIVVVASGGNTGPAPSTIRNVAPWIISVAASSIDRVFSSPVILGNGMKIEGQTVTPHKLSTTNPLVYAGDVEIPGSTNNVTTGQCMSGSLSPDLVRGKVVFCLSGYATNVEKGLEVKRAGGIGFILQNPVDGITIAVDAHVLPGTAVFANDSATIFNYIRTNRNPTAKIVPVTTVLGSKPSPFMAGFSSTGPSDLDPNILKPDITAPGLNILAAWSQASSPTKLFADDRTFKYNIISGTSMSCPHVASSAALIKSLNPNWTAPAVRSALMTTATQTNNIGRPITDHTSNSKATPFHYGSGHFQPLKALNPGLIYDSNYEDYLLYICSRNPSGQNLDPSFICPNFTTPYDLNYPSIAVSRVDSSGVRVNRTVTNVGGDGVSVYSVRIDSPAGYAVEISPESLNFAGLGQKLSFSVLIRPIGSEVISGYAFGWYVWSDGVHSVRSPIVVSS